MKHIGFYDNEKEAAAREIADADARAAAEAEKSEDEDRWARSCRMHVCSPIIEVVSVCDDEEYWSNVVTDSWQYHLCLVVSLAWLDRYLIFFFNLMCQRGFACSS